MKQITDEIFIGCREDIFVAAEIIDNKTDVQVNPGNKSFKYPQVKSYLNVAADLNINGVRIQKAALIDGKGNNKHALNNAVKAVGALIKNHGNVMVFCQKGESISALVVLAYLCHKNGMTIGESYDFIRFKKSDIKINPFLSLMICELSGDKYFDVEPETDPKDISIEKEEKKKPNAQATKKRGRPSQNK